MRNGFLLSSFVSIVCVCGVARADIFEVPLPVGEYTYGQRRDFSFDLGTELAEVRSVQFRSEGSMVAPLSGPLSGPYTRPINGTFVAALFRDAPTTTIANGGLAGRTTYPDPEPFSDLDPFGAQSWQFLLDGQADGYVWFAHGDPIGGVATGGRGVLTTATLIIDATPVPEPTGAAPLLVALLPLLRRRRRHALN